MKKRVSIPVSNPTALLELAKKVQSKHLADGSASLLNGLKWTEISPALESAVADHEKATQMKRDMLEAFQKRNLKLEAIIGALRDSRDVLSGVFKKEMKVLGQWGYDVLEVRSNVAQSKPVSGEAKV